MPFKRYLIGSKSLGLTNCKDTDYAVLDNNIWIERYYEDGNDYFIMSYDFVVSSFHHYNGNRYLFKANYQYDNSIIGNDFPIKYSLLENRLDNIILLIDFKEEELKNQNKLKKEYYHYAAIVFFLLNNKMELTSDQKDIIQKLHDCTMDISFRDQLIAYINRLEEDLNGRME